MAPEDVASEEEFRKSIRQGLEDITDALVSLNETVKAICRVALSDFQAPALRGRERETTRPD